MCRNKGLSSQRTRPFLPASKPRNRRAVERLIPVSLAHNHHLNDRSNRTAIGIAMSTANPSYHSAAGFLRFSGARPSWLTRPEGALGALGRRLGAALVAGFLA